MKEMGFKVDAIVFSVTGIYGGLAATLYHYEAISVAAFALLVVLGSCVFIVIEKIRSRPYDIQERYGDVVTHRVIIHRDVFIIRRLVAAILFFALTSVLFDAAQIGTDLFLRVGVSVLGGFLIGDILSRHGI